MRLGNTALLTALLAVVAGCGGERTAAVEARSPEPAAGGNKAAASPPAHVDLSGAAPAGIVTETVREETAVEAIRASGRLTVNENQTWRVGAITEGRIVKVLVNPGDAIGEGQVLARMHSHEVHDGRAEHRKALNELSRARSAEAFARQVRDRAQRLFDLKAAPLEQVERAAADVKNAQASIELANAELERARTHLVEFLQVAVEEGATHNEETDLIPVKAPAAGTLLERKVTAGSVVAAAADVFVISDLSTLWMIANVSESAMARVRVGQPARVEMQSQPGRSFRGRVVKLGEQLDPATRTLPVRIELSNAGGLLRPEMYADAELSSSATGGRGVYINESALQELKGQTVVFVEKAASQYDARAVETGRSLDGRVAILQGLAAGERVVVKGAFTLKSQLLRKSLAEEE